MSCPAGQRWLSWHSDSVFSEWTQEVLPQTFIKRASIRSILLWKAFTSISADRPTVCVDLVRQLNYIHLIKTWGTCSTKDWIGCTLAHKIHFVFPFRMIVARIQVTTRNCKFSKKIFCVVTDDYLVLLNHCHQLMILEEKQWLKNEFHHAWLCTGWCNQPLTRLFVSICKGQAFKKKKT